MRAIIWTSNVGIVTAAQGRGSGPAKASCCTERLEREQRQASLATGGRICTGAQRAPRGPGHPGSGQPLCGQLRVLLQCLRQEAQGRPWAVQLLLGLPCQAPTSPGALRKAALGRSGSPRGPGTVLGTATDVLGCVSLILSR